MNTTQERLEQMLGELYVIEDRSNRNGNRRLKIQSATDSSRKGTLCDAFYKIKSGKWFLSDKKQVANREAAMGELISRFQEQRLAVANVEADVLAREIEKNLSSRQRSRL